MMETLGDATWDEWIEVYLSLSKDLPQSLERTVCPQCGKHDLDVRYIGRASDRAGYVLMWCTSTLVGIHISQVDVPEGVEILPLGVDYESAGIPNFKIIPPGG
jgi:hypothetical protein